MRKHPLTPVVFATLIAFFSNAAHSQTRCEPQQRKELVVTVVDKSGSVIENLRADQLNLKLGDSPATISDVTLQNNTEPLDIVIMIDSSVSQEKAINLAKAGALSFISSIATAGRDRVAVVSFSHQAKNEPVLTSDFATVIAAIDQIKVDIPPGYVGGGMVVSASPPKNTVFPGSTALWDVIGSTTRALFGGEAEKRRRVMLVFSDGDDTSSRSRLSSVIEDAIKRGMAVFSVGLADPSTRPIESGLKKLSEQTGGIARFPRKKEALETALSEIGKHLRAQYVVGYCGELKSGDKLEIEVIDPELRKKKPALAYKRF